MQGLCYGDGPAVGLDDGSSLVSTSVAYLPVKVFAKEGKVGFDAAQPIALPFVVQPFCVVVVVGAKLAVVDKWCVFGFVGLQGNSAMTSVFPNVCRRGIDKGKHTALDSSCPCVK